VSPTGYDAFDDPYAYPGTMVLKNLIETKDPQVLQDFELEMTALRAAEPFPRGRFSPTHYRAIHHHLFQDVYSWAGRYRTVRTAKGGNMFCYPEYIRNEMVGAFGSLRQQSFLKRRTFGAFVDGAAVFLTDLNAIHPFREGNGRAQLSFMHQLAIHAGHPLDFTRIRPNEFLQAMIASFAGDMAPLREELFALQAR